MLQFSEEYFKEEIRSGFKVSEIMKRCWAAQLEVLHEIDELCKRHDITYFAFYGTLLGSVRHEGFVPWDDDVDLAFIKDDYIKFLQYAETELSDHLILESIYTKDAWDDACSRLVNTTGINISDDFTDKWYGCPFSVGVDIFPLYYIPRNDEEATLQLELLKTIGTVGSVAQYQNGRMGTEDDYAEVNIAIAENLIQLEHYTGYHFETDSTLQKQLDILYDQLGRTYNDEESDYLAFMPKYIEKGVKFEKQWLAEAVRKPFENITLSVPIGYDAILKKIYKNYMNPWRGGAAHDYPYFKENLIQIGETAEIIDLTSKRGGEENFSITIEREARPLSEDELREYLPEEWIKMITDDTERKVRKILFYYTGAKTLLTNGQGTIKKIKWVINSIAQDNRYVLWWFPCSLDIAELQVIKKMLPNFVEEYQRLIDEYKQQNLGICDESGDLERALKVCDLFYGDKGVVESLFEQAGKPVMIQNYGITVN